MQALVSTVIRYENHGHLYQLDLSTGAISRRVRISSTRPVGPHGGPNGVLYRGGRIYCVTYNEQVILDSELREVRRIRSPYLSGGHGIAFFQGNVWVTSCTNDALISFDPDGNPLDVHFLSENAKLMGFFGYAKRMQARDKNYAEEFQPYTEHLFHSNHLFESGGELYLTLNKPALIWNLTRNELAFQTRGDRIHDGVLLKENLCCFNDTGNGRIRICNREGREVWSSRADVGPYLPLPLRLSLLFQRAAREISKPFRRSPGKMLKTNWNRGMLVVEDGIWVGTSPASLLKVDRAGKVAKHLLLSSRLAESVFSIIGMTDNPKKHSVPAFEIPDVPCTDSVR